MAQHRPVEERIEALQAQMTLLETKANKEVISSDPRVAKIDAQIKALNLDSLKWKRWEKESPTKVKDFSARVADWKQRGVQATEALAAVAMERESLKKERAALAAEIIQNK